jgi:hypothetical protein
MKRRMNSESKNVGKADEKDIEGILITLETFYS